MLRRTSDKRKKQRRTLWALLIAAVLGCLTVTGVLASETDRMPGLSGEKSSLKVSLTYEDGEETKPVAGAAVNLYKVADLQVKGGSAEYTLTDAYADTGVTFAGMTAAQSNDAARTMAAVPGAIAADAHLTGTDGTVTFTNLTEGIYLITEDKAAGMAEDTEAVEPFLVMVPYPVQSAEGSYWEYAVTTYPKVEIAKHIGEGTVTVVKELFDQEGNLVTLADRGAVHVALFYDEACTSRATEVQAIVFDGQQNGHSSSTIFTNVPLDTPLYLAETDENGAPVLSSQLSGENYEPSYVNGQQLMLTKEAPDAAITFNNIYRDLTPPASLAAYIDITKNVYRNGSRQISTGTYYAGVFTDSELTRPLGAPVAIQMNGTSSSTRRISVSVGKTKDSTVTYYVTETDAGGTPLKNASLTAFSFDVNGSDEPASVTLGVNDIAQVDINNRYTGGSVTIVKELFDREGNSTGVKNDSEIHVALFSDPETTNRVTDVQTISLSPDSSAGHRGRTVYTGLEYGTYYLAETDAEGNAVPSVLLDGMLWEASYPEGQEITVSEENAAASVIFRNNCLEDTPQYSLAADLTITKKVLLNGKAHTANTTYYAGVFLDRELTQRYGEVIALEMDNAEESSATVSVSAGTTLDSTMTYYITETDRNGKPLDNSALSNFTFEISDSGVVTATANDRKEVIITNKYVREDPAIIPKGEGGTGGSGEGKVNPRTGDETPLALYIGLAATASLLLAILAAVRRRRSR